MALDLAAQAEHEPPAGIGVKIPGLDRKHRRAARKGDGDRGGQFDALGCQAGKSEWHERVVTEFE